MSLNKSISYINGFGLNRTKVLEKELKIYTLNDLLYFSQEDILIEVNFILQVKLTQLPLKYKLLELLKI